MSWWQRAFVLPVRQLRSAPLCVCMCVCIFVSVPVCECACMRVCVVQVVLPEMYPEEVWACRLCCQDVHPGLLSGCTWA